MRFVSLEGDLQDPVAQAVPIQTGDRHGGLVVVGHGDEAEAFAFVGTEVADHLDVGDRAERPKHLPQDALVRIRRQVVDKDAPACARVPREVDASQAGHAFDSHGGESTARQNTWQGRGGVENRAPCKITSK